MMEKLKMISGPFQAILFIATTWNPESNCTCREKNHFFFRSSMSTLPELPTHLWMYCWRKLSKIVVTLMEIDNCQIHGHVSQDALFWVKNHRKDIHGPGGDWQENKRLQDPKSCGWKCGNTCQMHPNVRKSKNGPKTKTRSRQKFTWYLLHWSEGWGTRRKLEIPMPAAMPCKTPINSSGENYLGIAKSKTKYACIVEADESTRIRLEGVPYRYHEDRLATKGINSLSRYSLVHKFIPISQALRIPDAKAAVEK